MLCGLPAFETSESGEREISLQRMNRTDLVVVELTITDQTKCQLKLGVVVEATTEMKQVSLNVGNN